MFVAEFITITIITILATVSPGPDFAMVTRNSLKYSRRTGVYTALGVSFGILVHVAYSLIGIGIVIAQSIVLFNIIKYIGAGYLIYIGWKSLRSKPRQVTPNMLNEKAEQDLKRAQALKMGFLTNAFNPKATLFFLSVFTQVISPTTPFIIQLFYGLEIMLIVFIWFALLAAMLSHSIIRIRIARVQYYFERAMGAVLIALGIKISTA